MAITSILPWKPTNIAKEVQSELNRRKTNRSFNYIQNDKAGWDPKTGDWSNYKGPICSWIRVCSNGAGSTQMVIPKPRFVFFGGKGFYDTYGFKPTTAGTTTRQIIGYMPEYNGNLNYAHFINNDLRKDYPIHVGTPEISKLNVIIQKQLFAKATFEWVCFSSKQLEYMTPYFLIPGISVIIEWGWNHFNPKSLVKLEDLGKMKDYFNNPYPLYTENILNSNGNYNVVYGIISNFDWSVEGNKFIANTEITSKDRLYAGISTDSALTIKSNNTESDNGDGILLSIRQFVKTTEKNSVNIISAFRQLASGQYVDTSDTPLSTPDVIAAKIKQSNPQSVPLVEIFNKIFKEPNADIKEIKLPYIFGIFCGRDDHEYKAKTDFDYGSNAKADYSRFWINMGLVSEILNNFSFRPGVKGQPMWQVDISTSVIGGHPNMISCIPEVLIPNKFAPKFHYGMLGKQRFQGETSGVGGQYRGQTIHPINFNSSVKNSPDKTVSKLFYQGKGVCYRNDLDKIINKYRYRGLTTGGTSKYSFPSAVNDVLYDGSIVERYYSGLLSNVYISYNKFKEIIESPSVKSFMDIYDEILTVLMMSVNYFWDLSIVEANGKLTIVDRNYTNKANFGDDNKVYSFDYYDADSIIKSLKFKPQLSDAVATRTMYGSTNNPIAQMVSSDRNDMISYVYKDTVILPEENVVDQTAEKAKIQEAREQLRQTIKSLQTINDANDSCLQMTLTKDMTSEIVKLILPDPTLLKRLLDDGDEDNNPIYCAIQPGITVEITLQGIGGLRTFQYFLIKNLPEPYSDKNIIFMIIDIQHTVESGNWETVIKAGILPLRKYIKTRLGIKS